MNQLILCLRELIEWVIKRQTEMDSMPTIGGDVAILTHQQQEYDNFRLQLDERKAIIENALASARSCLPKDLPPLEGKLAFCFSFYSPTYIYIYIYLTLILLTVTFDCLIDCTLRDSLIHPISYMLHLPFFFFTILNPKNREHLFLWNGRIYQKCFKCATRD